MVHSTTNVIYLAYEDCLDQSSMLPGYRHFIARAVEKRSYYWMRMGGWYLLVHKGFKE